MENNATIEKIETCRIEMFGGFRVTIGITPIKIQRARKSAELLAYLACFPLRKHRREAIGIVLFPETADHAEFYGRGKPSKLNQKLNDAVSQLGKWLEPTKKAGDRIYLQSGNDAISLVAGHIYSDVLEFNKAFDTASRRPDADPEKVVLLEKAIGFYKGELLLEFEAQWITDERRAMENDYIRALHSLFELHLVAQNDQKASSYVRHILEIELMDDLSIQLITIEDYVDAGNIQAASIYIRELQSTLKRKGLVLSPEIEQKLKEIKLLYQPPSYSFPSPSKLITRKNESNASNPYELEPSVQMMHTRGAIAPDSDNYVSRQADVEFEKAISQKVSVIVVKGPRQTGKTSLLSRGLNSVRKTESQVVYIDLSALDSQSFQDPNALFMALAASIAAQLGLSALYSPTQMLDPNMQFESFIQDCILKNIPISLVLAIDSSDRLFETNFSGSFFGLIRSWHEKRSTDPGCAFDKLTSVLSLSTEPHLYIKNINLSPFNVGVLLELDDFSIDEVEVCNQQFGSPLKTDEELNSFYSLLGGHPFLTYTGLYELKYKETKLNVLIGRSDYSSWIFGSHLRTLSLLVGRDEQMKSIVKEVLLGKACETIDAFERLRSAGVLKGATKDSAISRCSLYTKYLLPKLSE